MATSAATRGLSVTDFAARIDAAVRSIGGAVVEGEVQELHRSPRGHLFFDLTDGASVLKCKVWGQEAKRLQHPPKDGELVLVKVMRPDLWKQRGQLSLLVTDVKLAGDGELLRRRRELIARLTSEGLCDPSRLRPLPAFPRAVGVISGEGSDGLSDVIRAIHARFPPAHVITCPSLVQGKAAPAQVIDALARLMSHPLVDVILIARGGGSVQDLACFDDEGLCRAISACTKPVVCAIGHTPDEPVCNFVSHAAATPTHAPELIVPSALELRARCERLLRELESVDATLERLDERVTARADRLAQHATGALTRAAERVESLGAKLDPSCFERLRASVAEHGRRIASGLRRQADLHGYNYGRALARHLRGAAEGAQRRMGDEADLLRGPRARLGEGVARRLADARRDRRLVITRIEARDFRRHGYVLAADRAGRAVRSAAGLAPGARLRLNFPDGQVGAVVSDREGEDR